MADMNAKNMAYEIVGLRAEVERLSAGIHAVQRLINESDGIVGLHLNGDVAPWSELSTGGRYEEWLYEFDKAAQAGEVK